MADFRAHSVALARVAVPPTFRVHNIALDRAAAPVEREFRVHSVFLVHGFEPPVGDGMTRVRWPDNGSWVPAITHARVNNAWT